MIGKGWILRLTRDRTEASLVELWRDKIVIACDLNLALTHLSELKKLTIMGDPPYTEPAERRKQGGFTVGVIELGLDESYDWYCHIQ